MALISLGIFGSVVPDVIRKRYAAKLGVAFLLVILVIAAVGGVIFLQTEETLAADANQELEQSARMQADSLEQWIGRMGEEARLLSRAQPTKSANTSEVNAFLNSEVDQEGRLPPEVAALHVFDTEEGEIIASSREPFIGANPKEAGVPWAQEMPTFESPDDTTVTRPFQPPTSDTPVFAIISPVPDADRFLVFMVSLEERAASLTRPPEGYTQVVNSQGTVLLSNRQREILTHNREGESVGSPPVERGLNGETGSVSVEGENGTVLAGFAPIKGTNWVVMSKVSEGTAFALQRSISEKLGLLVLVSVFGLGLIGLTVGRNTASAIERLRDHTEAIADGDLDADPPETDRIDELGQLHNGFENMQTRLQESLAEATEQRERAEAARSEAEALSDHLEEKAQGYCDVLARGSDGDLTARMDPESESEPMTEIATAYNDMISEWEATVSRVQQFATEVTKDSKEMTENAGELESASTEVSSSMEEIRDGAEGQTEDLQDVLETTHDLSAAVEEIAASADDVAATARETQEAGQAGQEAAEDAIVAMDDIQAQTDETATQVQTLHEKIEEVEEVIDLIAEIAEQTNLLALNASIEAARAGEEGKGFAVVADEVKSLAEETRDATEDIETTIEEIQEATETVVADIDETQENVESGVETVEQAIDALNTVSERVENTNTGIQQISTATDDQASSVQEAVVMVEDVASVSEEVTSQAESVSTSSHQQTETATEVARKADALTTKASQLASLLDEFSLASDGEKTDREGADGKMGPASFEEPSPEGSPTDD
jgi:methyl-accepting chemotaxis protein